MAEGDRLSESQRIGREAARLKWQEGLTWDEVSDCWPNESRSRVRWAARKWKEAHPEDYPTAGTPFDDRRKNVGVEFEEEGNTATARSLSTQVTSLDELLDACDVDLDIWEVEHWTCRTYDGWRGDLEKDITWEDGKIVEGYVRDGGIITKTLYSIYAKLVRQEPVALEPTFSVISCPIKYDAPCSPSPAGTVRSLLFSDPHIGFLKDMRNGELKPFHDRRMLDVIVQIAARYKPDYIGVLGDLVDLARFTRHYAQQPEFYWTTQPALYEAHWFLRRLREVCPNARIIYPEGNHEVRLPSYVRDHMIEACGLTRVTGRFPALALPELLDLEALQVEFIDGYDSGAATFRPVPWMIWEHGTIARIAGNTAKAYVERSVRWRFSGHTHRCELASRSFNEREDDEHPPVSSVQFGCCCHTDGRVPGSTPDCQWQKRFGVVEFDKDGPPPSVEIVAVRKGRAIWRGERYVGEDYTDQLRATWPDWNW